MLATKEDNKPELYNSGFPKKLSRNKHNLLVNNRLKIARNKKGYSLTRTVAELEKRGVKCAVSTIQGYETDEQSVNHRYPSIHMIIALADLYGCSVDYLVGVTDEYSRPSKDLLSQLKSSKELLWDQQKVNEEQRNMIIFKTKQIMSL